MHFILINKCQLEIVFEAINRIEKINIDNLDEKIVETLMFSLEYSDLRTFKLLYETFEIKLCNTNIKPEFLIWELNENLIWKLEFIVQKGHKIPNKIL